MKVNLLFKDGKISKGRELLAKLFSSLNGNYEITINRKRALRSNSQNAAYWGIILEHFQSLFLESTGELMSKEQIHEIFKMQFNFTEIYNEKTGEVFKIGKSTAKLNKVEFSEYIERLRQFSLHFFNVDIPDIGCNN